MRRGPTAEVVEATRLAYPRLHTGSPRMPRRAPVAPWWGRDL